MLLSDASSVEPNSTILLVGADASERSSFVKAFENEGFRTLEAEDAVAANDLIASDTIDLIVMDRRLPHGSALSFCRKSAGGGGAPIILLADDADETDRIVALEVGADNLMSKPVSVRLLLAETRALLRRQRARAGASDSKPDEAEGWGIDLLTREAVSPTGRRVSLPPGQASLFGLLLDNPGIVFSDERIAENLGWEFSTTACGLRTMVSRLRKSLQQSGSLVDIRTVRGSGYVFG